MSTLYFMKIVLSDDFQRDGTPSCKKAGYMSLNCYGNIVEQVQFWLCYCAKFVQSHTTPVLNYCYSEQSAV